MREDDRREEEDKRNRERKGREEDRMGISDAKTKKQGQYQKYIQIHCWRWRVGPLAVGQTHSLLRFGGGHGPR